MNRIFIIILLCAAVLTTCGEDNILSNNNDQSNQSNQSNLPKPLPDIIYLKISAEDAYQMMRGTDEYILLDVRTDEEFKERRIEGAVLIPDYEIQNRAQTELPDKNALILIYCRSGRRSANAADELIEMGYTKVYDFGGIIDWPYDTVSG